MRRELLNEFEGLTLPSSEHAIALPRDFLDRRVGLGKYGDGSPVFFYDLQNETVASQAIVKLRHIEYHPSVNVIVESDGREDERKFALFRCVRSELSLYRYFISIGGPLILEEPPGTIEQFDEIVRSAIELFRSGFGPGVVAVQGLWGELYLIYRSKSPEIAVLAWHSEPHALHDFVAGDFAVEVKTTKSDIRVHEFLLDQLNRPPAGETLVASIMLKEDPAGISLEELHASLSDTLADNREVRNRLDRVLVRCLGEQWRDAALLRFNANFAEASLRYFRVDQIPAVSRQVPAEVTQVQFRSDLSGCIAEQPSEIRILTDLFSALVD